MSCWLAWKLTRMAIDSTVGVVEAGGEAVQAIGE